MTENEPREMELVPIAELRSRLIVALTTAPRTVMADLGKTTRHRHDVSRRELIDRLTAGWENWEIRKPVSHNMGHSIPPSGTIAR
jgi:hypothetical protein